MFVGRVVHASHGWKELQKVDDALHLVTSCFAEGIVNDALEARRAEGLCERAGSFKGALSLIHPIQGYVLLIIPIKGILPQKTHTL